MRSRWYAGTLAALLVAIAPATAQQPPQPQATAHLTREQALADTRTFLRLLEETHPDPYSDLGGKIAFKRKAQAMITSLPAEGLSVGALAERLGAFVAPLHDGHTNVTLHNATWRKVRNPLPIRFQVASDALFVAASDLPELRGARGARVLGVNGHQIAELRQRLSGQIGAENRYGLDRIMASVLQSEALIRRLIPELGDARGITYNLEAPDGTRLDRDIVAGGTHGADPGTWMEKPQRWAGLSRSDDLFYHRMLDSGRTAYFRVASMGGREAVRTYQKINLGGPALLHQILEEYYQVLGKPLPANVDEAIAGIPSVVEVGTRMLEAMKSAGTPNLIIDVRGNGGGMTGVLYPLLYQLYGDDYFRMRNRNESITVMSPLYMEFFNVDRARELARNPDFEVGWYRVNGEDDEADSARAAPGTAEWAAERRRASLAQWRERGYWGIDGLDALGGKPLYRPKRVVVLVDPVTFSAGFQIEFILRALGATLVGVPSSQSPNAFMQVTSYTLSESHLAGSISNSTQVYLPETPDVRVLPMAFDATYAVFRTYGFDEDTSLRYALDLLRKGKI